MLQELAKDGGPNPQALAIPLLHHNLENCQPLSHAPPNLLCIHLVIFFLVDKWWANMKCYFLTTWLAIIETPSPSPSLLFFASIMNPWYLINLIHNSTHNSQSPLQVHNIFKFFS
jgi:hypothetical protein